MSKEDDLSEEEVNQTMNKCCKRLIKLLPEGMGFILLIGGKSNYTATGTNLERDGSVANLLQAELERYIQTN